MELFSNELNDGSSRPFLSSRCGALGSGKLIRVAHSIGHFPLVNKISNVSQQLAIRRTALVMASLVSSGIFTASGSCDGPNGCVGVQAVAKAIIAVIRKPGVNVVPIRPLFCASIIAFNFLSRTEVRSVILSTFCSKLYQVINRTICGCDIAQSNTFAA